MHSHYEFTEDPQLSLLDWHGPEDLTPITEIDRKLMRRLADGCTPQEAKRIMDEELRNNPSPPDN